MSCKNCMKLSVNASRKVKSNMTLKIRDCNSVTFFQEMWVIRSTKTTSRARIFRITMLIFFTVYEILRLVFFSLPAKKCREQNSPLYIFFIDLTNVFYMVIRDGLFKILTKIWFLPKFQSSIKSFHKNMKMCPSLYSN